MNITELKKLCRELDLWPKKSKGQNFLLNTKIVQQIIMAADLKKSDTVIEVGPGFGVLTEELIKKAKLVISVELDQKIFGFLEQKFAGVKNLRLINSDILTSDIGHQTLDIRHWTSDISKSFKQAISDEQSVINNQRSEIRDRRSEIGDQRSENYKVVANLPYQITSAVIRKFLTAEIKPEQMVIMVQKEVAERIIAKPPEMNLLALSVQYYGQPKIKFLVSKNNFWPIPRVDSAILQILNIHQTSLRRKKQEDIQEKDFFKFINLGFSHKRKKLINNLRQGLKIDQAIMRQKWIKLGLDLNIRAQNLTLEQWFNLINCG